MKEKLISIPLQECEIIHNMYDAPVTFVTIFEGQPPSDFLQNRASQVLAANPWLASRLSNENQISKPCFYHPVKPELSPFYEQASVTDICKSGTSVDSILAETYTERLSPAMLKLFTKHGFNSLNKDEPLCKIRLCTGSDNRFMVLFSMSHILGDGFTAYRIYSMLNPSEPVASMIPQRIRSFQRIVDNTGGTFGSIWFPKQESRSSNSKLDWMLDSKAIWSTKESREKVGLTHGEEQDILSNDVTFNGGIFQINTKWVAEQKKIFKGDSKVPWISTNDIITSWFLKKSKADMGAMAINTRNRTPELGMLHAGNYQIGFLLTPDEYSSPCAIRESIATFSASTKPNSSPGLNNKLALISSWTQRYADLNFGTDYRLLIHIPLCPEELSPPVMMDSVMILFCSGNGSLSAAIKSTNIKAFLDQTALGNSILG
ncbi:hypothetical protein [Maridesulfovibrio zosterae]|uniref:hypothetical protein n=1 Tax=Maridesulfovibrio zosterae TaxID=82171 RepID=UPI0003F887BB|nr:hypothetical protein [Maridesulfovibrio zosterae]